MEAKIFYSQEGDDGSMNESHTAQLSLRRAEVACIESCAALVCVYVCVFEQVCRCMFFNVGGHKSGTF